MFRLPTPSLFISVLALFVALGGAGYSATGGNFLLGQTNTASSQTRLTAPFAGAAFRIENNSTGANATGISIAMSAGHPPFVVNTSAKVRYLNADLLDGMDSTGFVRVRADVTGTLSFGSSIPANNCASFNVNVPGAAVGDAVILTFEGGTPPPASLLLVPQKVTSADILEVKACNPTLSASTIVNSVGVRIIALR